MAIQLHAIEADFIVVGAGSAGCAVAARLSEDPGTRVLLLEAGGDDDNRWIHIPLGFGKTFADPSVNWCYETEPDPGAGDRRVYWPRGKVLGGSSSINGMVYIRGQAEDFDHWRQLGNTGWSFEDVLPYFRRAEHQTRGADEFHGSRAVGVNFRREGRIYTARAAREIILCGGAINSPQLLLLSGIGPREQLAALGIPVVQDLPGVGQRLQDHYSAPLKLRCRLPITVNDVMQSNVKKLKVGLQYYLFRSGPLAMCTSPAALFARTRPELASPDVKLSIQPFSADRPQDGLHKWSGFSMIAYQLRPDSRGEIKLRSADPSASPAVHPNYLTAATDQQTIVAGLRLCRELLAQTVLAQFVASEYLPGSAVQSDAELLDFARRRGGTVYHPTSTCKMGIDPMAVVDPDLRVRGVTGLRVADASIMPTVISGNTNAATIMIGERCADLVRQEMRIAA